MKISIHQPNFVPWFPFFQKIEQSDVFVIMAHCQFEKGKFQNRFSIDDQWYTMAVDKGMIPIHEKRYTDPVKDWTLITDKFDKLKMFDPFISNNLATTNTAIIMHAARMLGIKTEIVLDYPTELTGTARLLDLCRHYGANEYLSGISGKEYLDVEMFKMAGIKLEFQDEKDMIKKPLIERL